MGREEFLGAARALAQEIVRRGVEAKDGSITWRRPSRGTSPPVVPAGPHLYDGLPGIAIFFAAMARVEGGGTYRRLSLEVVAPLRRLLAELATEPQRAEAAKFAIGGLSGVGSFIYALVTLGRLLDTPELIQEARQITSLISPKRLAADETLDVLSGAAGTILALLALDRHLPSPDTSGMAPLGIAARCARHLLQQRITLPDGTTAWKTDPRHPLLNGFAHGASGICCALLRLYARTGEPELRQAAKQGWAFERTTYSDRHQNWRDLRVPEPRFPNGWCYGAPGVALARLTMLEIADGEEVRAELRHALESTADPSLSSFDHLCCGNMGRVEVLLHAHHELGSPKLLVEAQDISRRVLRRAEETGRFRWMIDSDHFDPSFFAGASGIGYTLLRLAGRRDLPSVLALE